MRKLAIIAGISMLGIIGLSSPAFADGPTTANVDASAVVSSTLSLTGTVTPIDFGTVTPGTPSVKVLAEQPTVTTNSPGGAELTLDGHQGWMNVSTGLTYTSSPSVTVTDETTGTACHAGCPLSNTAATVIANATTPGAKTYKEDFALNFSSSLPPANVSTTYIYTAIAN